MTKYIPIGTTFDDAERVLRAAGFQISARGKSNIYPYPYQVLATIDQYVPTLFGKTSVVVVLEPEHPGEWRSVAGVTADIVVERL